MALPLRQAISVPALSTGGRRLAPVPARVDGNSLVFTADVAGFKEHGAILCYEVATE